MNWLKNKLEISSFFCSKRIKKPKKQLIFALAISNGSELLEKWQSGRMRQS